MAWIDFYVDGVAWNHAHRRHSIQPTSAYIWVGRGGADVRDRGMVQFFI